MLPACARHYDETMRTDVVTVPVSVRDVNGRSTLVALKTADGRWASVPLATDAPRAAATDLLESLLPVPKALLPQQSQTPRPVGFGDGSEGSPSLGTEASLTLVYSVAVPMAMAAKLAPGSDRWVPLLEPEDTADRARNKGSAMIKRAPDAPQFVESILGFWRQQLEETACALAFLAEYWTMSQLRDVYSAVWGYQQDPAGFGRWADPEVKESAFFGLARKCEDAEVLDLGTKMTGVLGAASIALGAEQGSAKPEMSDLRKFIGDAVVRPGGSTAVGVSLGGLAAIASAGLLPFAMSIAAGSLAVVAARIAYQPERRGPEPKWYTNTAQNAPDRPLSNGKVYTSRPAWIHEPRKNCPMCGGQKLHPYAVNQLKCSQCGTIVRT